MERVFAPHENASGGVFLQDLGRSCDGAHQRVIQGVAVRRQVGLQTDLEESVGKDHIIQGSQQAGRIIFIVEVESGVDQHQPVGGLDVELDQQVRQCSNQIPTRGVPHQDDLSRLEFEDLPEAVQHPHVAFEAVVEAVGEGVLGGFPVVHRNDGHVEVVGPDSGVGLMDEGGHADEAPAVDVVDYFHGNFGLLRPPGKGVLPALLVPLLWVFLADERVGTVHAHLQLLFMACLFPDALEIAFDVGNGELGQVHAAALGQEVGENTGDPEFLGVGDGGQDGSNQVPEYLLLRQVPDLLGQFLVGVRDQHIGFVLCILLEHDAFEDLIGGFHEAAPALLALVPGLLRIVDDAHSRIHDVQLSYTGHTPFFRLSKDSRIFSLSPYSLWRIHLSNSLFQRGEVLEKENKSSWLRLQA